MNRTVKMKNVEETSKERFPKETEKRQIVQWREENDRRRCQRWSIVMVEWN